MKKLIKNGTLVTEQEEFAADILIQDGVIREIGNNIECQDAEMIDAAGMYVLPGAVDIHTHMDLDVGIARTIDDFYTGTIAAACGGTTTIVDHMAFGPKDCSLWHMVNEYHKLADGNAVVDYGFHGVFQHVNPEVLREMGDIAREEGITSFKVYMTYGYKIEDADMMQILEQAKKDGILITVHCENDGMVNHFREKFVREGKTTTKYQPLSRPAESEAEAVNRMLYLAKAAGEAPLYIVHLSTEAGLREIEHARANGQKHVGVETCPQYLLLEDSRYENQTDGLKAMIAPPLRKPADNEALWEALKAGEIDAVATDHCTFTFQKQKQQGASDFTKCPSGAPGVEERLVLMYSEGVKKGRITMPQLVRNLCTNPARVSGLYPQKGVLQAGADADIVLLDPKKEWVLTTELMHGASDYTCYEGMEICGAVDTVLSRGKVIAKNGEFLGKKGDGKYLKRGISSIAQ